MRHSIVNNIFSLAALSVLMVTIAATGAAQSTPKKPSIWQQVKDAAKQGAQQGQPQQPQQQPGQQPGQNPGQKGQRPGQQQLPRRVQGGGQVNDSGPFKPPAGTKIEETVLAPLQERASFEVSPHGVHVATTETDGSRAVVYYDRVVGPKFDEILRQTYGNVVFSPDGNRYAYCARSGNQYVVMVDGKELVSSPEANSGRFDGESCRLGFTSNNKHVYYTSHVSLGGRSDQTFTRFVFDGKPGPQGSAEGAVLSPDGDHYAYNLTISDPYHGDRHAFVVDGKIAPYLAGAPQWTADSKHLYTQRTVPAQGTELLFDGKPIMRAFNFAVYISPVGDMVAVAVTGGTRFSPFSFLVVNGKKVPGSDTVERGAITKVEFSPDGKHYAALCGDTSNHHYVIVDGKRGQEYISIDKLTFTADSSTVVYTAYVNGKTFVIVGEQEFGLPMGAPQPIISPVGNRVGAFIATDGTPHLLMDKKITALSARGGSDLSFTPDGAHYAYFAVDGLGGRLVIDGVPQPQSALSGDRMDMQNVSALKYIFSADSKHVAHFAVPPTPSGDYQRGVFLDGKYVVVSSEGTNTNLSFSPDSKHLFWIHQYGDRPLRVFIDGKPLVDFYTAGNSIWAVAGWWDFGPDGTLSFLAQDDNSLKRITITLSPETSLATMLGGGSAVAAKQ